MKFKKRDFFSRFLGTKHKIGNLHYFSDILLRNENVIILCQSLL